MIGAGTSIEHPDLKLDADGFGIQFNVSLNNACALTSRCGARCFLNIVQPNTEAMPEALRAAAIREILDAGRVTRHLALVEKEPMESADQMRAILRDYRSRVASRRPQSIGCITNGLLLRHHLSWLAETPLDWCLTSLDGEEETHLRGRALWRPSLSNLLAARTAGAARLVGVNTVVTDDNIDSVVRLGQRLPDYGVDYWGLGVYLENRHGVMTSSLGVPTTVAVVKRIADAVRSLDIPVVFELEEDAFECIAGFRPRAVIGGPWRLEHAIEGTPLRVATMSPEPGRFLRLRFDGALLDKADLLTVGVLETRYGHYTPGKISRLLNAIGQSWPDGVGSSLEPISA